MARYIDADELIEFITKGLNNPDITKAFGYDAIEILAEIEYAPKADVVPESEVERLQNILDSYALQYGTVMDKHVIIERARAEEAKQVLSDLKKQVHDKATYPHNSGIDPYMSLKVFDAILNNIIKKYSEGKNE